MVRIYMFTVCLVLLLGMSTCVPVWAATPSASYDYDAATHYDHSLDSDCQSTPPGCSYVALEHKTDCVHSESRTNNTGLFGILCWSSIIVVGYLSVSRDYDTPSNKFNNSPHRPNYDVRIEPRCTSTTTLKNEMSMYRAYFVPGGMDPSGTQQDDPRPCGCEDAFGQCFRTATTWTLESLGLPMFNPMPPVLQPAADSAFDTLKKFFEAGNTDRVDDCGKTGTHFCCVLHRTVTVEPFRLAVVLALTRNGAVIRRIQLRGVVTFRSFEEVGVCVEQDAPCRCEEVKPQVFEFPALNFPLNIEVQTPAPAGVPNPQPDPVFA